MNFGEILKNLQKELLIYGGSAITLFILLIVLIHTLEKKNNSWRDRKLERTFPKEEEDDDY